MNSNGSCVGTVDTGWVDNNGRKISTAHLFVIIFEVYTYTYSKIKYIFKECLQKKWHQPRRTKNIGAENSEMFFGMWKAYRWVVMDIADHWKLHHILAVGRITISMILTFWGASIWAKVLNLKAGKWLESADKALTSLSWLRHSQTLDVIRKLWGMKIDLGSQ